MPAAAQFPDFLEGVVIDSSVMQPRHSPIEAFEDEQGILVFDLFAAKIFTRPTEIDRTDIQPDYFRVMLDEFLCVSIVKGVGEMLADVISHVGDTLAESPQTSFLFPNFSVQASCQTRL